MIDRRLQGASMRLPGHRLCQLEQTAHRDRVHGVFLGMCIADFGNHSLPALDTSSLSLQPLLRVCQRVRCLRNAARDPRRDVPCCPARSAGGARARATERPSPAAARWPRRRRDRPRPPGPPRHRGALDRAGQGGLAPAHAQAARGAPGPARAGAREPRRRPAEPPRPEPRTGPPRPELTPCDTPVQAGARLARRPGLR